MLVHVRPARRIAPSGQATHKRRSLDAGGPYPRARLQPVSSSPDSVRARLFYRGVQAHFDAEVGECFHRDAVEVRVEPVHQPIRSLEQHDPWFCGWPAVGALPEVIEEGSHLGRKLHTSCPTANDGHGQGTWGRWRSRARGGVPRVAQGVAQAQRVVQAPEVLEVLLQLRSCFGGHAARVEDQILVADGTFGGFDGLPGEIYTGDLGLQELAGTRADGGDG